MATFFAKKTYIDDIRGITIERSLVRERSFSMTAAHLTLRNMRREVRSIATFPTQICKIFIDICPDVPILV